MYVDASDFCNTAAFQLGSIGIGTTVSARSWSLKVSKGFVFVVVVDDVDAVVSVVVFVVYGVDLVSLMMLGSIGIGTTVLAHSWSLKVSKDFVFVVVVVVYRVDRLILM